jgi:hypothetical protein
VAAFAFACGPKPPSDPVERLVFDLAQAAMAQDADRFGSHLGQGFTGEGGLGRAEALAELRRYFTLYKSVEIGTAGLTVDRSGAAPLARFRASFAGKPKDIQGLAGLLPETARFQFELTLLDEGGALKVARAAWQRVEAPPAQ